MSSTELVTDKLHNLAAKATDPLKILCEIDLEDNKEEQVGILTLTQTIDGEIHKEQTKKLKDARKSAEDGWVEVIASGVKNKGELTLTLKYITEAPEEFIIFENIPYDDFIKFGSNEEA